MATIAISDLRPVGSEFFADSESYLHEFEQANLTSVQGGATPAYAGFVILGYLLGRLK